MGKVVITPESLAHQKLHYYENRTPAVIGGSTLLISLASTAVFLRLLSRRIASAPWRADDYSIIVALIFAYGLFVTLMLGKLVHPRFMMPEIKSIAH